jgi:hypothetical protein
LQEAVAAVIEVVMLSMIVGLLQTM